MLTCLFDDEGSQTVTLSTSGRQWIFIDGDHTIAMLKQLTYAQSESGADLGTVIYVNKLYRSSDEKELQ